MPPNPALVPIKAFVRQHGGAWPAWAFKPTRPARRAPAERPPPGRVFVITPEQLAPGRRFVVVAQNWNAAFDRLGVLLS